MEFLKGSAYVARDFPIGSHFKSFAIGISVVFEWNHHITDSSFIIRYEILTPNVIPRGILDGKEAAKKMVSPEIMIP